MLVRMQKRGINTEDVEHCLRCGDIIEHYQSDYPYPSCLVLGSSAGGKALHVVCGLGDGMLWMVTAYYPDIEEWDKDFRTRR